MFITRKVILGISVLISGIIILIIFYNKRNRKWFDTHKYINEINKEESYSIKRIADERIGYYYNDHFATEEEQLEYYRESNPKERIGGHIFYDTVQQTFWAEVNGYIPPEGEGEVWDQYNDWINFNLEGTILERKKEVDSTAHKNLVVLKNEIANFYDWDDESTLFYVQRFGREKFIWESLNPLRGYGSPTGGTRNTYWEGFAYFKLQMQKSTLQFKTRTRTTDRGYIFRIDLYRLPKKDNSEREMAFLIIDEHYLNADDRGLYLITNSNY
jgi:hypothetical protein